MKIRKTTFEVLFNRQDSKLVLQQIATGDAKRINYQNSALKNSH